MNKKFLFLVPLVSFSFIFFPLLVCILIVDAEASITVFDHEVSYFGYYPGAKYIVFAVGFTLSSLFFLATVLVKQTQFPPSSSALINGYSVAMLITGFLQVPFAVMMGFSNGIISDLHTVSATISWALINVYIILSAILEFLLLLPFYILSLAAFLSSIASIVLFSVFSADGNELLEWLGLFMLMLVLIIFSLQIYLRSD